MDYDYPIGQLAWSKATKFQMGFACMAIRMLPKMEDIVLKASREGLMILGTNEMALTRPREIINQINGDNVVLDQPQVRLVERGGILYEPVMWIRESMEDEYVEDVVNDLIARDATMEEVDWALPQPVVRARAPLRSLIGYQQTIAILARGTAVLRMWLSHYQAIPGPGKDAA